MSVILERVDVVNAELGDVGKDVRGVIEIHYEVVGNIGCALDALKALLITWRTGAIHDQRVWGGSLS